jgi:hypothetical protein
MGIRIRLPLAGISTIQPAIMNKAFSSLVSAILCLGLFPAIAQVGGAPRGPLLGGATGKLFGDNQTFSATMELQTSDSNGKTVLPGKLSFDTGKSRFDVNLADMQGGRIPPDAIAQIKSMGMDQIITIARPDKHIAYIIYPGMLSYVESDLPDSAASTTNDYKVETVAIGQETVDGHPCEKNKVTVTDKDGKHHESIVWDATDLKKFPMEIQTADGGSKVTMLFRNVSLAKPDAALFDAPPAYAKYDNVQTLIQQQVMKHMNGMSHPPGAPGQ